MLATSIAFLMAGLTRTLLSLGGRLLRWADTLMLQSARWQDQLLPPAWLDEKQRQPPHSRER